VYDELYAAWKREVENAALGSLPPDFYSRAATYLHNLNVDSKSQDAKTVRSTLLEHEMVNVARLVQELVGLRYRKLLKLIAAGKIVPLEKLAAEEVKLYSGIAPSAEVFGKFQEGLLKGQLVEVNEVPVASQIKAPKLGPTRVTVRFLKPVPSIMGADMQSYGPFLMEDVASVPSENAKILVKQGLVRVVELSP
jgi:DNA replication initiation complex subunit (GINS family)